MDLEAVENAFRSALHQAGAAGLSELLEYPAPAPQQRRLPCPCGSQAQYQTLRSKPVLTVLGPARVSRPYYPDFRTSQGWHQLTLSDSVRASQRSSPQRGLIGGFWKGQFGGLGCFDPRRRLRGKCDLDFLQHGLNIFLRLGVSR